MLEIDGPSNYWINMFNFSVSPYLGIPTGARRSGRRGYEAGGAPRGRGERSWRDRPVFRLKNSHFLES
eukprot:5874235-Prymnesium_polylepis.1